MQIRIIGGEHRGRKITVVDSPGLRPTPNRVRETLFNWLASYIEKAVCLDLFAGSGLLSFEALSRGAEKAVLIEKNKKTSLALKKNAPIFKESAIKIYTCDSLVFLNRHDLSPYNIIFLDPPFNTPLLNEALLKLKGKLKANTLIYTEAEKAITSLPFEADCLKQKKSSDVHYALFKVITS